MHACCPRCAWHRPAYLPLCLACVALIAEINANGGHAAIPPDPWTTAAARAHDGARWRRFRA